ncbi:D-inositol-3-phosphate glycosyltransferase [Synechococcus sp. MIT S9509]|uniref:rhamnan synthesis F family protein n=1 Tax=unclassified Synechococcus TaxID=2626047 RepID=UPI0007BC5EE6|nr:MULTISPECIES: rhamnan synthesis F family protein [unclassified Synechococcus]KZR84310.1 D-inositol-3-phosphate glycosyltransferase [Synechococcus sp. MIT S9504]KZR89229.1 D-inositol-3-phosphate glycosyltransferase [Synechococcus sp. MIT S9509]
MTRFKTVRVLINSPLGRQIKPLARWSYARLLTSLGMDVQKGRQAFNRSRPTAMVVSHEASATGAPILALNLVQQLSQTHNVVVLLLKGGPLLHQFQANSTAVIKAKRMFVNRKLVRRAMKAACPQGNPEFALVNSVVSAPLLEPLRGEGIACLCLVHEFVTYVKPLEVFAEVGLWSSRVVCSTPLTWSDVLRRCNHLADVRLAVLPQGRCQLPAASQTTSENDLKRPSKVEASDFLNQLPQETLLVLGAGAVQPRKGVDLFVAMAAQIVQQAPELNMRFAWIGSGYEPDHDFSVSVWLEDQISRSGLSNHLVMLEESPAYQDLINRSNLFVVSSRLDPLPNVAIDAMLAATPVLCFQEACGIANLLEQQPLLHSAGVAPYFDYTVMARKAVALLRSPERMKQLGALTREHASRWFHMPSYIKELIKLAGISRTEVRQEESDLKLLLEQKLVNANFAYPDQRLTDLALNQRYLLSWGSNIRARKPFPGFHPGIYREHQLANDARRDPLAHWQQQGQPKGPWLVSLIQPHDAITRLPDSSEVALHIHVFYPELLAPILERLGQSTVKPDLFLSFSDPQLESKIRQILHNNQQEASLHPVPNRGRDIGPLLSELGQQLDRNYTIHGHLHTKKSVLINSGTAERWRDFILANLLGDAEQPMADIILAAINSDADLGLVFPDDPGCLGWTENRVHAERLAERLGIQQLPQAINFPVGTMFWARQGALSNLYNLGLNWNDYPEEPLGYDGTMLHAIERLLPQICMANGKRYAMTHVPGLSR